MSTAPSQAPTSGGTPWWLRCHRALMPDYNRKAAAYWWLMVALGTALLWHALSRLAALPAGELATVVVGTAIAMIAALVPVRIPRSNNSFAAGEIFIFLLLLLHGPAAAAVAAAAEGLVGSWRTSQRWTSRIASPAMACVAMTGVGSLLHALLDAGRGVGAFNPGVLLMATMLCAVLYFVVNTVLITAVLYLKRNQRPVLRELFGNFAWIGITFAGSASVACLLFLAFEQAGIAVLIAAIPIIAMLLVTMHYYFRERAAEDQVRKSREEAAGREAELATAHMKAMEVSERRFHSAFTHASIGMALVTVDGRVLQVNAALCKLLGLGDDEELAERRFEEFVRDEDVPRLNARLAELNQRLLSSFEDELRLRRHDGTPAWAALHASFFAGQDSTAPCLILQLQDVTARRTAEAELQHIAFHDSLTGLPNRRRFQEQLSQTLRRVNRDPRRHFGLLFLDFDRFKLINDSLGHAVGDDFLLAVARRIQHLVRPHDIVARLGGDEFAIIAEDLDSARYAVSLADRLLEAMRDPIFIQGNEITTSASIGITFSSLGYADPADMVRDADIAMYKAKAAGKGRYALFDTALHTEVSRRMRLEGDLRRALGTTQLSVVYQPLYELATGNITGFEALTRWTHPELGPISPAEFIPIAEDVGLIVALTDFVLKSACTQLRQWQLRDQRLAELKMHVNVSGNDVVHPQLVARVTSALSHTHVQPEHLTLELTENILMERLEAALPALKELRQLGLGLSVDDFGTGYSSLQHLSALPVNTLKIDRAFVTALRYGTSEAAVVRGIVLLGESLGKSVIAEGIETPDQLDTLRRLGCSTGQGYHLSRPLVPELVDKLLDEWLARSVIGAGAPLITHETVLH